MLYAITHLKAPWPHGAVVGDVLDLQVVPAWAVNKCAPAPDDAVATVELEEISDADTQAAAIDQAAEAHALELAELRAALEQANGAIDALRSELDASKASAAELQAQLDAKVADVDPATAALQEAEAQAAAEKAATKGKSK